MGTESKSHVRIPLTASVIVSLVVGAASSGLTWGLYSSRLEAAERKSEAAEIAIAKANTRNAEQDTQLAVITTQYQEIIRRLGVIEQKVERR